jgi:hypothetical protein
MNTFSQSQSKRAAAIALINSMASSGVIVSSSVYNDLVHMLPLTPLQVLLAIQLGAFIRELVHDLHLDEHPIYGDAMGI